MKNRLHTYLLAVVLLPLTTLVTLAQAPNITYSSPQTYVTGTAITTLSPYNTGGAVPNTRSYIVSTFAGSTAGTAGSTNATGTAASFSGPRGVSSDASGNLYIADATNNQIRKITSAGVVTLFAGPVTPASGNVDGTTTAARFNNPLDITDDPAGNFYVTDNLNNSIRKITPAGVVTTLATVSTPVGIAYDALSGALFVTTGTGNTIVKVTLAGVVTTYAGSATAGRANAVGTAATFTTPNGITTDEVGNLYIADQGNNQIRKINSAGSVTLLAGDVAGTPGNVDGTTTGARFDTPRGIGADPLGNIYVTDNGNFSIRLVTPAGVVTTVAGGTANAFVDGTGTAARFNTPRTLGVDSQTGVIYMPDFGNNAIRKILVTGYSISAPLPAGLTFNTSNGQITGTPTVVTPATTYTISGSNSSGSSTTTLSIATVSSAPSTVNDLNAATNTVPENSATGTLVGLTAYTQSVGSSATNLALNKTVTVTSLENAGQFPGSAAVDGNTGTRWSSAFSDPQDLTVDLGSIYDISRVKITWEAAYAINYQIQVSTDNITFTTIKTVSGNSTLVNDLTALSSATSAARYVRMHGTTRATGFGYSIIEFEVYGSDFSYSLTNNAGGRFAINSANGVVSVLDGTLLDYETATSHSVTVQATNGTTTLTQSFAIAVTDANDAPVITSNGGGATATITVANGATAVTTVTATDVDPGNTLTYSANSATFNINATTGVLTFASAAAPGTYPVTVTATDNGGLTDTQVLSVVVTSPISGYAFVQPITINTASIPGAAIATQTNFPVLVYIKEDAIKSGVNCANNIQFPTGGTNGYDMAFTLNGSTTELFYQVESFDSATGTLLAWVQIPSLTATNVALNFYFGSLTPVHTASFTNATWAGDYKAVYHFMETPAASSTTADATANGRTGTTNNMVAANLVTGQVGNAYSFNGTNQRVVSGAVTLTSSFTLSAWIKLSAINVDQKILTNQATAGSSTGGYKMGVYSDNTIEVEAPQGNRSATPTAPAFNTTTWRYVQGVFNTADNTLRSYVDGTAYKILTGATTLPSSTNPLYIGVGEGGGTYWFNGVIDELRISNIAKSADWIRAEYYNQTNVTTFTNSATLIAATSPAAAKAIGGSLVYTWTGTGGTSTTTAGSWKTPASGNPIATVAPVTDGTVSIVIPNVTNKPILAGDASFYGITVDASSSFNLSTYTLTVGCNVYNNGTINSAGVTNTSTLAFNGIFTPQLYTGTNTASTAQFGNITINNTTASGIVRITGGPVDLYNTLTLTAGSLDVNNAGNGALTLKNSASQTARVAQITSGAVTGNVRVERFLSAYNLRGYRLMSSPVNSSGLTNLDFLANSAPVTGAFTSVTPTTKTGINPTIYLYNETLPINRTTFVSGNFVGVTDTRTTTLATVSGTSNTPGTGTLPVGNGYFFFFRGNYSGSNKITAPFAAAEDVTFTTTGTLNQGPYTVKDWYNQASSTLSYTGTTVVSGFHLVGNPYASSIDWTSTGITKTALTTSLYQYNSRLKVYAVYNAGVSTNFNGTGTGNIIPSGQGFFIRGTSAAAALTFTESAKTATTPTSTNSLMSTSPVAATAEPQFVRVQLQKDSLNSDESVVLFNGSAKPGFDVNEDSEYFPGNGALSLSTMSADKKRLAINQMAFPKTTSETVPLNVAVSASGLYHLYFNENKNIPALYEVYLKDAYKKDSLDVLKNNTYNFNALTTDTNTFAHRFSLVIRQKASLALHLLDFDAEKVSLGAKLTWVTENESNYTNFTVERSTDGGKTFEVVSGLLSSGLGTYQIIDKSPALGQNQYRLKQDDVNGTISYSKAVNLMYTPASDQIYVNNISVYPNPASSVINVAIVAQTNAKSYNISITNGIGMVVRKVTSNQTTWQNNVSNLLPGTYFVQVVNNDTKAVVGNSKFVKN